MPYIIPSSAVTPGTVYQPGKGVPAYITANARAMACIKGGALSATHMLDQSPRNNGTRRTGEKGRCYTADGTDDEVNYGDIGSAIWFSGWVKLNSDDQCLFSLSNDTNTNLIVSSGVLTAGATLTLSAIKVDNVTKTASEAGALLNDNLWHFLSCGIGDGLGGASTADDVRYFTDGTNHGSVSGFDWRFWATAPTADELTEAYSGESTNRNSASLSKYALWSKMDEQGGTTSYDSSGNDLTGTITNATLATFHATQDIWSFQNQVGYNLSGSVYIPRDESDPSNDVLGNPLIYSGRRPNDLKINDSNCLKLNGINQAVRVIDNPAFDITDNLTIMVWPKFNSATPSNQTMLAKHDIGLNYREYLFRIGSSQKLQFYIGDDGGSSAIVIESDSALSDLDSFNLYSCTFQSGSIVLSRNGIPLPSTASGNVPTSLTPNLADLSIGCFFNSGSKTSLIDGQLFDARIYNRVLSASEIQSIYEDSRNLTDDANLVGRWKSQEGAGAVVYDSSGNENHGTIENAASNWGVTQDLVHSNLLEGFSLYEHASSDPIRVPFGSDGQPLSITPPTGYSKTSDYYAGDYHNDAETTVDFDPDSTPEMGATQLGITVPSAHAFGDAFTASDQIFSRQRTKTEDRFLVFTEAQTGSALTNIQKYTQP
jgi:hypothetical protein